MAHIKSAKKRMRQTKKRTIRNKIVRTSFRERIKAFRDAVAAGNADSAQAAFKLAISSIASAESKGVLHKNTASRYISRLNLQLNKLKSGGAKSGTV